MTKPTMELVEEYGRTVACNCVPTAPETDALLSEIRQRIEAMERREAELESDLAEAAKCAFQYAAKVGGLERDKAMLDWLADVNSPAQVLLPIECVTENVHSMRDAIAATMARVRDEG